MAQTLKSKFYVAGKNIGKALDITSRLDEIMKEEEDYETVASSNFIGLPRENEYWGIFRIMFGRILPAIFVWPILTPLITIIILSVHILYHAATALMSAAATIIGTAISGFKWLFGPKAASTDNTQIVEPITAQELEQDSVEANSIGAKVTSLIWGSKSPAAGLARNIGDDASGDDASLVYLFKEQTWLNENENKIYQQCADAVGYKAQSCLNLSNPIKHFAYKKVNNRENEITIGYVSYQETSGFSQGRRFNVVTAHMSVHGPSIVSSDCISLGGGAIGTSVFKGCVLAGAELCETKVLEILGLNKNIQSVNTLIGRQLNVIEDRRSSNARMFY
jgi:hypothetical protein